MGIGPSISRRRAPIRTALPDCAKEELRLDDSNSVSGEGFRLTDEDGGLWYFDAATQMLTKMVPPGREAEIEYVYDVSNTRIEKQQRVHTWDDGGVQKTTVELRYFEYDDDDRVTQVTLQRGTDPLADPGDPSWTRLRRLQLRYYQAGDWQGNAGDLKSVTEQVPKPNDPGQWTEGKTDYYRYYTSSGAGAYQHGLKFSLSPQATKNAGDYETIEDVDLAGYANHYFEYDETSRRVTLSRIAGGTQTFSMAYTENADIGHVDYNHWFLKTELSTDDGRARSFMPITSGRGCWPTCRIQEWTTGSSTAGTTKMRF